MRWRHIDEFVTWKRVFAFVPHYCEDAKQWVWGEFIYRRRVSSPADTWFVYRAIDPIYGLEVIDDE